MHDSTRAPIVTARFERGEKSSTFRVGIFAAGDASHSEMRFPGFFMLPVYLDQPLENGTRFQWSTAWPLDSTRNLREADQTLGAGWMWGLPHLLLETGRAKRYEAVVKQWDQVETPLGKEAAACIEVTITYVEKGQTQAVARDTYWYAPRLGAVVKAVREGEVPDESARRIAVDLVDIQPLPFELVDSRWPKDKIATNLGDGSVVAADSEFSPDRLALVRRHLAAMAGPRLAGKRVQVNTLVTWYVRTPQTPAIEQGRGLPSIPVEEYFGLPKLREYPYWVICSIDLSVDNRHMAGRGAVGFRSETPEFSRHHQEALMGAVNRAIDKKL